MLTPDNDHSSPSKITILQSANDRPCAKVFTVNEDGETDILSYGKESHWHPKTFELDDLDHLAKAIKKVARRTDCIAICGEVIHPDNDGPILRRKDGDEATIRCAERCWMAVDVDGVETSADTVEEQIAEVRDEHLPAWLYGVRCFYQLTSSYGIKPGLRARLWFWLDTPINTDLLRAVMFPYPACDPSIYICHQPIYVCSPRFDGVKPPISPVDRFGFVDGYTAAAIPPEATQEANERVRYAAGVNVQRKDVEPDEEQIKDAIEKNINQSSEEGRRHGHVLGAVFELYLLGAEPTEIADMAAVMFRNAGREPEKGEIAGMLKAARLKDDRGEATTSNPPISVVLPDSVEDDDEATDPEGNADLFEIMDDYDPAANDLHNARVFVNREMQGDGYVRWQQGDWFYNGKYWERQEDEETLMGKLAQSSGSTFSTAKLASVSRRIRAQYQRSDLCLPCWIDGAFVQKDVEHAIIAANGIVSVEEAILDAHSALRPHDRNFFCANAVPYDYDADAKCPRWMQCLEEWFPGDPASQRELQKLFGYLLVSDNAYERFFVLTDRRSGRTGKGTVCTVLQWLVGEMNIASLSLRGFGERFGLAQCVGKSVAFINEANAQNKMDVPGLAIDRLKMVTGNDNVEIERKRENSYNARLNTRFVMSCNRLPNMPDPSGALMRRMHIIEFGSSFHGREDRTLKKVGGSLYRELSGILNWAIEGLAKLYYDDKGFIELEAAKESKASFLRSSAPVKAFIEDCCVTGNPAEKNVVVASADLYAAYTGWCEDEGIRHPMRKATFCAEIRHLQPQVTDYRMSVGRGVGGAAKRVYALSGLALNETGNGYIDEPLCVVDEYED